MVALALEAARLLLDRGVGMTVVDPRWLLPVSDEVVALARDHSLVATVEDSGRVGGFGAAVTAALRDLDVDTPVQVHAIDQQFPAHCKRDTLLARSGLTAPAVAEAVLALLGKNSRVDGWATRP
jgi:1-deoxy-D-xylulose-5-phosphate synthase